MTGPSSGRTTCNGAYALFNSWRLATLLLDSIGGPARAKLKSGGRHGFTHVRSGSIATDPFGANIVPRQELDWKRT
ncbi:MAG: hypothetical protein WBW81_07005 [Methylocella sp.]